MLRINTCRQACILMKYEKIPFKAWTQLGWLLLIGSPSQGAPSRVDPDVWCSVVSAKSQLTHLCSLCGSQTSERLDAEGLEFPWESTAGRGIGEGLGRPEEENDL